MRYPKFKEGVVEHDNIAYEQCGTDEEVIRTVLFGDILYLDDNLEVWVHKGKVAVLRNQIGILE